MRDDDFCHESKEALGIHFMQFQPAKSSHSVPEEGFTRMYAGVPSRQDITECRQIMRSHTGKSSMRENLSLGNGVVSSAIQVNAP